MKSVFHLRPQLLILFFIHTYINGDGFFMIIAIRLR